MAPPLATKLPKTQARRKTRPPTVSIRKQFFFEKKNKTFANCRTSAGWARDSHPKVFCFFSSEKKFFLS
jgi:hypothetical protein